MREDGKAKEEAAALPVFHRLRPPDETHRNQMISRSQIRSGEPRQDLKIPIVSDRSLPRALSCSHHEVLPVAARRKVAFSHSFPCNWVPFRWFAPSWTVCTNSPFSPTTTSGSGNCSLEPNPDRYDKAPLAVAIGNWFRGGES